MSKSEKIRAKETLMKNLSALDLNGARNKKGLFL